MTFLWAVAGICASIAIGAGWADRRRRRRADPDRVGYIDWPTVQVLALFAFAVSAALAVA